MAGSAERRCVGVLEGGREEERRSPLYGMDHCIPLLLVVFIEFVGIFLVSVGLTTVACNAVVVSCRLSWWVLAKVACYLLLPMTINPIRSPHKLPSLLVLRCAVGIDIYLHLYPSLLNAATIPCALHTTRYGFHGRSA